ncbi:MAG: rod shape-determining protein RodA [Burkholderiales bacterium]|jgi:rod shape determining protein RodA|nr:rod shape-determining protein RodA [Burkholderiaceae bacterium]NBS82287.1 rod shape-determining protein RodA [Betaproteobacteria bacterium]NBT99330.1 rod shape-determining protein RodA [Betaproteobacteria bacterium]NCX02777.1 rod shape-determining protein RodA [Betaproteobacteria bacterium]NDE32070.1 rod shape-determining protein RodA [Betaproteobacteria bacterium]
MAWSSFAPLAFFRRNVDVFDRPLLLITLVLMAISMLTMLSAAADFPARTEAHARNLLLSLALMWLVARIPVPWLAQSALPLYALGLVLLIAVALFGDVSKGARRWLHLGIVRIQPSELMKIAMPLMLAWFFAQREGQLRASDFAVAAGLLLLPLLLIIRQPDLGTGILVFAAGGFVLFMAGFSYRLILPVVLALSLGLGSLWVFGSSWCAPDVHWMVLHDYQKQRVCTLLDPSRDPLGKGFHILQSMIAVGSGGLWGKGWFEGTQTHLEFIPERTTDFIFAVFGEEWGLLGNVLLIGLYAAMVLRGLEIARRASTLFERLASAALTLMLFTYAFVNMGMVTGVLPVVGVPLPFMSYGGTAAVTLGLGLGIVHAAARQRRLVQT